MYVYMYCMYIVRLVSLLCFHVYLVIVLHEWMDVRVHVHVWWKLQNTAGWIVATARTIFTCVLEYHRANLLFLLWYPGGVTTASSGAPAGAGMGGDLLTPLSAGLEGLSLAGKTQPSFQVFTTCSLYQGLTYRPCLYSVSSTQLSS